MNGKKIDISKNISILIPAFNPDTKLITLVDNLTKAGFTNISIVDDGSSEEYKPIFNELGLKKQCNILVHAKNMGKGRALKTGFNYFLNNCKDCVGIVTADADGQHGIEDIIKVSQRLIDNPEKLILGSRNFSKSNIPFRSRFGNIMTRRMFGLIAGIKVRDTQTGLRAISSDFALDLMSVNGERFEYETNMLLECKSKNIAIDEVCIDTIYIEENKSSHFNPIKDSIKIYGVFFKFMSSSFLSFVLDIGLFTMFTKLFYNLTPEYFILLSTIVSRIISSLFNYNVNKNAVFKHKTYDKLVLVRYYVLCLTLMLVSGLSVSATWFVFKRSEVVIKVIIDGILSLISYKIQKEWVFKKMNISEEL
ncbi:bifunctional glycosyltransferase family 2/GtrA family protein [Clostridium sp. CM028]|uniref:glycosyltransferase n=1 Tax=Clostridium sp. CM028 TaxID=2851575 RepID=UPI001C6DE587|nr:glycosyltransferase [Clostridium sp. CM028]MBW9148479.1 bifunctional glycosyltransferase family 2/GtrA family protein [Clostridium sp. CM028]WLC61052.1 bifunctional glycosyltransferase family 2/GtrA family protein [Clostridium sp. CM028]